MRSYLKIFITLIAFVQLSLVASAQTQTGIVKTKGRLGANGSVVSGKRLPGASVKVQGRNAVLSNNNGVFTFPVPGQRFSLVSASKTGYVLTDPDILMRQHTYSGQNPVFVVMETPETQLEDQLASERKIRRNLSQRLAAREQEIEQLKNDNKITKQEYQKLMQELYANQESNEKLIKDMAKRYASMDYDQLDDLNRRVQAYILDGNLIAADSLINSKGDIVTRANNIKREQKLIAAEKKELTERLKVVSQLETGSNLDIEDIAKDCMHKAEIHKFNLRNDSAAFYLELRADLDTLNVDWQIDAGEFFRDALADYDRAKVYLDRIESFAHNTQELDLQYRCLMHLAQSYFRQDELTQSEEYATKALVLCKDTYGIKNLNTIKSLNLLGDLSQVRGNHKIAMEQYKFALNTLIDVVKLPHDSIRPLTVEELSVYYHLGLSSINLVKSLELFNVALHLSKQLESTFLLYYDKDSMAMTPIYTIMGILYSKIDDYCVALDYLSKVYNIDVKYFGENHPSVAHDRINLAEVWAKNGEFQQAFNYANLAINCIRSTFGDFNSNLGDMYNTLGLIYYKKGEYESAIHNYNNGIEILIQSIGPNYPGLAHLYENKANAYKAMGDTLKAEIYDLKAMLVKDSFSVNFKSSIKENEFIRQHPHPNK